MYDVGIISTLLFHILYKYIKQKYNMYTNSRISAQVIIYVVLNSLSLLVGK
jgi:hypothetical protein